MSSTTTVNVFTEIKNIPVVAGFSDDELHIITQFSDIVITEKDQYIFQNGDKEQSLFLIKSGSVGVYKENRDSEIN